MREIITNKKRNINKRERRAVVLVVTSDKRIAKNELYRRLNLSSEGVAVILLQSDTTGSRLKGMVKRYVKENDIKTSKGDRIIFLDEMGDT